MRIVLVACLLVAASALPAVARPGCRVALPDGRIVRADPRSDACRGYRPVGERETGLSEERPRPRPFALPRGRDSLPMPGPF